MGIKKKMLTVCLAILLIIPTLVYAIEQKNYFDINMMENDIYNVTYLNATYFYQDGTALESFTSSNYFNKSDIEGFGYYNSSDFLISNYYTTSQIDGFGFYNSTDFSISDYFTKTQINNFDYWNDTYATFNQTYADTRYLRYVSSLPDANISSASNWNNAYAWTNANHSNWDEAYDWGDHSVQGYITAAVSIPWENVTKPGDCSAGDFVTGIDGASLDCSTPSYFTVGDEEDQLWEANYTACAAGNHLYFSGDSLACESDDDTTYSASGTLLDLTDTTFSINEGTLTDERICEYESTGTQLECTLVKDGSGECGSGAVCLGDHTHDTRYFTETEITNFDYWNNTFATFNKTYADTLYAGIGAGGWAPSATTDLNMSKYDIFNITMINITGDDAIHIGSAENDHFIYFYEDGDPVSEYLKWDQSSDYFRFSDSLNVVGTLSATDISAGTILATSDINTYGSGDDLWLGSGTQSTAKFKAYADGSLNISEGAFEVTAAGEVQVDSGNKVCLDGATCSKYIWYNGSNVQIVG